MKTLEEQIISGIYGCGRGWAFSQKDFASLGTRGAIDMVFQRLLARGTIRRVIRGIYDYPQFSELRGQELSPDLDLVAAAFADAALLKSVVESKEQFYPRNWARYDLAKPGTIKLLPPEHVLRSLRKDHQEMQIMIYGERVSFEAILDQIRMLENEINSLTSKLLK